MQEIFEGAVGQKIILDVDVDISAATTRRIKYRRPDGTLSYWTATEETTTSISYTTVAATDIPKGSDGIWKLQAYVVTPAWTNHGEVDRLLVKETL